MEKQLKSINDLFPLELIRAILLRIPIKELARSKCVSKLWNTLISDPNFAESHLHHSLAPTHTYLLIRGYSHAYSVDLNALLVQEDNNGVDAIGLSLPFNKKPRSIFYFLGSCRGLVLLQREQFLILWNPLISFSKRISYSHIVKAATRLRARGSRDFRVRDSHDCVKLFNFLDDALLYGFGYHGSQDEYVVVVAYEGKDGENHFDMCCLGSNSWINLDAALPKPLKMFDWKSKGLFCNGAIHWYTYDCREEILIFDLKERTFSKISVPEQLVPPARYSLVLLGGCLGLYSCDYYSPKTEIWVMKEYRVQSSWTVYEIPLQFFRPLSLSVNGDITGSFHTMDNRMRFYVYNVSGELLKPVQYGNGVLYGRPTSFIVCADSLMSVPSNITDKMMKRRPSSQTEKESGQDLSSVGLDS
ncbi:hypothetical protein PIB30_023968 [Stylosanthes scabra]|uniref:F-box domain-containing protein n=1 Tax=Stylosanthes scabra TaxID=79078 RepID=A0ABU6X7Q2_9FABA|nr:hypothetical protein [Stylosanthes scabra]